MSYRTIIWLVLLTALGFVHNAIFRKHDNELRALEKRVQQLEQQLEKANVRPPDF